MNYPSFFFFCIKFPLGPMKRSWLCCGSFRSINFRRRSTSGGVNLNKGLLSDAERGDQFTEPSAYRKKNNITTMIKVAGKTETLRREERQRKNMGRFEIDSKRERELLHGIPHPKRSDEIEVSRLIDNDELSRSEKSATYTSALHRLMEREVDRRDHMMDKFGQAPTAKEFHRLFKKLRHGDDVDETIEGYQTRLIEEYGIYPSTRLDAYMLDDDTCFPEWVNALPYSIRDRVKYGSLGLTEEEEALRVSMGRLPLDQRKREWERLKHAKEYKAAKSETLTLAELRDARQGKRRFHWLQRKRQKRASALRRLALRKPEPFELWPSSVVDYTQRLAFIAQCVENGLDTKGEWPLNKDELLRARVRRSQEEAERTFLKNAEEKKLLKKTGDDSILQILHALDTPEKPFKRLSRKVFANRVNAITHGDQDEYGRKYRKMAYRSKYRMRSYESLSEIALQKEVRKEPRVYTSGLNHTDDEHWPKHTKSWSDGMPSTRYAS